MVFILFKLREFKFHSFKLKEIKYVISIYPSSENISLIFPQYTKKISLVAGTVA